jgi:hypothetical protein
MGRPRGSALSVRQILMWADAHRSGAGEWPKAASGPIPGVPGQTWNAINLALRDGHRGLPGGSSLSRLLARRRYQHRYQPLTVQQVLRWVDAHRARTGRWPGQQSGTVPEAAGLSWRGIDDALRLGLRGLPGGDSLARLLARERGVRNLADLRPLTVAQILAWADAHHTRTGCWPTAASGPVADAPGETWGAVNMALYKGRRGLPGGDSLAKLLDRQRRHKGGWSPAAQAM